MHLSSTILGASTTRLLTTRSTGVVLTIGRDGFTRGDLARVECFNYQAASTLSAHVATLDVRDTAALFVKVAPTALLAPGLGAIALAVLGAAFQARGLGGDAPLEAWYAHHAQQAQVFATLKAQARRRDARATRRGLRRVSLRRRAS